MHIKYKHSKSFISQIIEITIKHRQCKIYNPTLKTSFQCPLRLISLSKAEAASFWPSSSR